MDVGEKSQTGGREIERSGSQEEMARGGERKTVRERYVGGSEDSGTSVGWTVGADEVRRV